MGREISIWTGRRGSSRGVSSTTSKRGTSILHLLNIYIIKCIAVLWKVRPELLLVNGPGTCVPVVYSVFLLQLLSLVIPQFTWGGGNSQRNRCCKIIFMDSLCRVKTLSLSGKLVYPIVDWYLVHWPYLKRDYPLVEVCDVFVQHHAHKKNAEE